MEGEAVCWQEKNHCNLFPSSKVRQSQRQLHHFYHHVPAGVTLPRLSKMRMGVRLTTFILTNASRCSTTPWPLWAVRGQTEGLRRLRSGQNTMYVLMYTPLTVTNVWCYYLICNYKYIYIHTHFSEWKYLRKWPRNKNVGTLWFKSLPFCQWFTQPDILMPTAP